MVRAGLDERKERAFGVHVLRPVSIVSGVAAAAVNAGLLLFLPFNTQLLAASLAGGLASGGARIVESRLQQRKLGRERKTIAFTLGGGAGAASVVYLLLDNGIATLPELSAGAGLGTYLGTWLVQEGINALN